MKCEKCNRDVRNDPRNIVYITLNEIPVTCGKDHRYEARAVFLCDSCKDVLSRCPQPQWIGRGDGVDIRGTRFNQERKE